MQRRSSFTLVELLVSTALIAFILVILAQAFETATDSVSILKAQIGLQEKLRSASGVMRADLSAPHFIGNGAKLSDQDLSVQTSPLFGFFRVWQGSPYSTTNPSAPYYQEESRDSIFSYRASDHILHFTIQGTDGTWYAVAYFLRANGDLAGTTPLYSLYRESVPVPYPANPNANAPFPYPSTMTLPNAIDVTNPTTRLSLALPSTPTALIPFMATPVANQPSSCGSPGWSGTYPTYQDCASKFNLPNDPSVGDDLLLTDVVSFEVQILSPQAAASGATGFVNLYDSSLNSFWNTKLSPCSIYCPTANPAVTTGPAIFDTWAQNFTPAGLNTPATAPLAIQITAIQVTLRVWDSNTKQARQISFVQAM